MTVSGVEIWPLRENKTITITGIVKCIWNILGAENNSSPLHMASLSVPSLSTPQQQEIAEVGLKSRGSNFIFIYTTFSFLADVEILTTLYLLKWRYTHSKY